MNIMNDPSQPASKWEELYSGSISTRNEIPSASNPGAWIPNLASMDQYHGIYEFPEIRCNISVSVSFFLKIQAIIFIRLTYGSTTLQRVKN